jgi:hypothetical protein
MEQHRHVPPCVTDKICSPLSITGQIDWHVFRVSQDQSACVEAKWISSVDLLACYFLGTVTPIFKDKNRMHKRLMCTPGYDRTHK